MPSNKRPEEMPHASEKQLERSKLVSKGVPMQQASFLAGEGENLTREEITARRIAWQKTLPKES